MFDQLLNPQQIAEHRQIVTARMSALLRRNKSDVTVDEMAAVIFEAEHERPAGEQLADFIRMFKAPDAQIDTVIALVQEAWNYFPHRTLDGLCPAEVMARRMRVSFARRGASSAKPTPKSDS